VNPNSMESKIHDGYSNLSADLITVTKYDQRAHRQSLPPEAWCICLRGIDGTYMSMHIARFQQCLFCRKHPKALFTSPGLLGLGGEISGHDQIPKVPERHVYF
jgi:hypothetical protein